MVTLLRDTTSDSCVSDRRSEDCLEHPHKNDRLVSDRSPGHRPSGDAHRHSSPGCKNLTASDLRECSLDACAKPTVIVPSAHISGTKFGGGAEMVSPSRTRSQ